MGAEFYYRDTAWRKAKELYYRDAGVWRKLKEVWYRDGGVWRKVFSGFAAQAFSAFDVWAQSGTGTGSKTASCNFLSDGTYTTSATPLATNGTSSGNWGTPTTPGIGSAWSIKVTVTSGSFSTSGTTGSWVSLASTWFATKSGSVGSGSVTFDVAFSSNGGATTDLTVTGCVLRYDSVPA